jgi:hypothetical protein
MTSSEYAIAQALMGIKIRDVTDQGFVNQLKNWYNRDMTTEGYERMIRLLDRHRSSIPDYESLKSASVTEQIQKYSL